MITAMLLLCVDTLLISKDVCATAVVDRVYDTVVECELDVQTWHKGGAWKTSHPASGKPIDMVSFQCFEWKQGQLS